MAIRPFDWRDLPVLHTYRHQCLFFDSRRVLTRGAALIPAGALLATLWPATAFFTALQESPGARQPVLLGQAIHTAGAASAQLACLAPTSALATAELAPLLEYLETLVGGRGAFRLLAEVDEQEPVLPALQRSGFAIYARQRIWRLSNGLVVTPEATAPWRACTDRDLLAVRALYNNLVPGLAQQFEPPPQQRWRVLVHYQGGELLAYAEIRSGPQGVWVQPFIHPNAEGVVERLARLLQQVGGRHVRPRYVCVRSYQSWLEQAMEDLGAEPGARQAVTVKRLAAACREPQAAREVTPPEPAVPVAR
jgi:hypothetical protein